jgi:hypothetical protein
MAISFFALSPDGIHGATGSGKAVANIVLLGSGGSVVVPVGTVIVVAIAVNLASTTISTVVQSGNPVNQSFSFLAAINNSTSVRIELWALTVTTQIITNGINIVVTPVAATATMAAVATGYSGVSSIGKTHTNTGSSTGPTDSITIDEGGDWVTGGFAWNGVATISANTVGNGRGFAGTIGGTASTNCGAAESDNTSAVVASVTNTLLLTASSVWAAASVELRPPLTHAPVWNMPFLPGFGNGR